MTDDVTAAGRTVISKAAVILMTYLNGDVHTLTEIATATGLPLSTAHRLVRELAAWKILERTDDGDYCVGLPLRLIGGSCGTTTSLEERACLVLQDLSQALDADVRLGVLGDRDVTFIEKPRGRRPVTTFSQGATAPAHATAMGKALLAFSAPAMVDMLPRPRSDRVHAVHADRPRPVPPGAGDGPAQPARRGPLGAGARPQRAGRARVRARAAGSPRRSRCGWTTRRPSCPTVRPALVIAGRSLTRELSATPEVNGRGPGLRPHPNGGSRTAHAARRSTRRHAPGCPCPPRAPAPSRSSARPAPHRTWKVNGQ